MAWQSPGLARPVPPATSAKREGLRNRRRRRLSLPLSLAAAAAAQVDRVRSLHYCRLRGFIIRTCGISRVSWSPAPRAGPLLETQIRESGRAFEKPRPLSTCHSPSVCLRGPSIRPSSVFSKVSSRAIMRTLKFVYSSFRCSALICHVPTFEVIFCGVEH